MSDSPKDIVDKLLAAPDSTKLNDAELKKYNIRTSRERARKAQEAQRKSPTQPTIEDMLADLVRVAEDESVNPWHETRTLGRKLYERHGDYLLDQILSQFGEFAHALEVAGLRDQAGTRLKHAARAIASRKEHAARYVERYVHPYVARQADYRELHQPYLLLSISDTHATFLDPFTWHCFLSAVRDLKPSGVLINGDAYDMNELSRHPKVPGQSVPLGIELSFVKEMFRQIRAMGFDGDLWLNGGNHDVDRMAMYLTQVAQPLAGLPCLRMDQLLGLDAFDVKLMMGGTIASPAEQEHDEQGFLMFGFYRPHHGTRLGQNPARAELLTMGRSGQSGHVHRADMAWGCTEKDKGLSWMCTPMGCTERVGRNYIKSPNKGWQKGFGICYLYPDGDVDQHPVVTDNDRCTIEGHIYTRTPNLPDPDPLTLWLPDVPLPTL